jgi:tRNA A-37 threonylcarbamoyl transferase component Bud32
VRYFGDYELLEEVARGGMGVVYQARQLSLSRIVAVKMILSGNLASEAEVKRFRAEAQAAANLQHPNIVAIHEVGAHEGHHFFSMDYVEGRNLAELTREGPFSAAKAALCLKAMAEAIHYAHQHGTLHRDLKPSNVILDRAGQPHITDFGLAKLALHDSDLTHTGAVLGTPSYMSPEQAAARHDQTGPASDVYSLGAILYQLLTARAPFAAATPWETLRLVREEPPDRPTKLNPRIPTDLEKRPERRYASAQDLAEDLTRFLNHEPIRARPANPLRKIWAWSLRHPWTLTGVLSLLLLALVGWTYGMREELNLHRWRQAHPNQEPSVLMSAFFPPGLMALVLSEFFFLQMVPLALFLRASLRGPLSRRAVGGYLAVGLTQVGFGLFLAARAMAANTWTNEFRGVFAAVVMVAMLTNVWFGGVLVWQAARELWEEGGDGDRGSGLHPTLLRLRSGKALWLILGLEAAALLLPSAVAPGQFAQRLPEQLGSGLALSMAVLFYAATRCSAGIESSVYVPPLLCCLLFSAVMLPMLSPLIALIAVGIGLTGGVALVRYARLDRGGQITSRKTEPTPAAEPRGKRTLLKVLAPTLAVVALLVFDHLRGRWALAAWRREQAARGEVIDIFRLWPATSPEDKAAAERLMAAGRKLDDHLSTWAGQLTGMIRVGRGKATRGSQSAQANWEELGAKLNLARPALEEIRAAAANPPRFQCLELQEFFISGRGIPNFVALRGMAQSFHVAALSDLHRGDLSASLPELVTLAALARVNEADLGVVAQLIRLAILGLAVDVMWDALQAPGWTEAQLAQLQRAYQAVSNLPEFASAVRAEQAAHLYQMARFRESAYKEWVRQCVEAYGVPRPTDLSVLWQDWVFHPLWRFAWADLDDFLFLRNSSIELEAMRRAALEGSWTELTRTLEAHYRTYRAPLADWRFHHRIPLLEDAGLSTSSPSSPSSFPFGLPQLSELSGRMLSSAGAAPEYPYRRLDQAWQSAFRYATIHTMVITHLALRRYQLSRERIAPNLGALVPEFLDRVPRDPMDGQPLRYRLNADGGYTLYSVGQDGKDGGGVVEPGQPGPPRAYMSDGPDMIWPTPVVGGMTVPTGLSRGPGSPLPYHRQALEASRPTWPERQPRRSSPAPAPRLGAPRGGSHSIFVISLDPGGSPLPWTVRFGASARFIRQPACGLDFCGDFWHPDERVN